MEQIFIKFVETLGELGYIDNDKVKMFTRAAMDNSIENPKLNIGTILSVNYDKADIETIGTKKRIQCQVNVGNSYKSGDTILFFYQGGVYKAIQKLNPSAVQSSVQNNNSNLDALFLPSNNVKYKGYNLIEVFPNRNNEIDSSMITDIDKQKYVYITNTDDISYHSRIVYNPETSKYFADDNVLIVDGLFDPDTGEPDDNWVVFFTDLRGVSTDMINQIIDSDWEDGNLSEVITFVSNIQDAIEDGLSDSNILAGIGLDYSNKFSDSKKKQIAKFHTNQILFEVIDTKDGEKSIPGKLIHINLSIDDEKKKMLSVTTYADKDAYDNNEYESKYELDLDNSKITTAQPIEISTVIDDEESSHMVIGEESDSDNLLVVKGDVEDMNSALETFFSNLKQWITTHTHPTPAGPSGPSIEAPLYPQPYSPDPKYAKNIQADRNS